MQQPGILQPAEADSPSIGRRRFTEKAAASIGGSCCLLLAGCPPLAGIEAAEHSKQVAGPTSSPSPSGEGGWLMAGLADAISAAVHRRVDKSRSEDSELVPLTVGGGAAAPGSPLSSSDGDYSPTARRYGAGGRSALAATPPIYSDAPRGRALAYGGSASDVSLSWSTDPRAKADAYAAQKRESPDASPLASPLASTMGRLRRAAQSTADAGRRLQTAARGTARGVSVWAEMSL
jgi:hypothetical protein